jgi:hypothetical protein
VLLPTPPLRDAKVITFIGPDSPFGERGERKGRMVNDW